jgi:prepilin-type processing-associated H-X9-DG protein
VSPRPSGHTGSPQVTRAYTSYGDGALMWRTREFIRATLGIAETAPGAPGASCSILLNLRNASHSSRGVANLAQVDGHVAE